MHRFFYLFQIVGFLALAGISTIFTLEESKHVKLCYRFIAGGMIGFIYFIAIVIRTEEPQPRRSSYKNFTLILALSSLWIVLCMTMTPTSSVGTIELKSAAFSLVYVLSVLLLSHNYYLVKSFDQSTNDQKTDSHLFKIDKQTHVNMKPIYFLIGAKLLAIFCSNMPFVWLIFHFSNSSTTVEIVNTMNLHLIILFSVRLFLGIFTILVCNNSLNENRSAKIYLSTFICAAILLISVLLMLTNDSLKNYKFLIGTTLLVIYIALSLYFDAIGHIAVAVNPYSCIIKKSIALAFGCCIEHLINILLIVIYFSNFLHTILIVMPVIPIGYNLFSQTIAKFMCHRIKMQVSHEFPIQTL